MIVTNEFRIPASEVTKGLVVHWLSRWWWALSLPLLVLICIGYSDWRFLIVALALLLVTYPGVLIFVYYYYALSPQSISKILPQYHVLSNDGINIVYKPFAEGCKAKEKCLITFDKIEGHYDDGKYEIIVLKNHETLQIPINAFENKEDFYDFRRILGNNSVKTIQN